MLKKVFLSMSKLNLWEAHKKNSVRMKKLREENEELIYKINSQWLELQHLKQNADYQKKYAVLFEKVDLLLRENEILTGRLGELDPNIQMQFDLQHYEVMPSPIAH